MYYDDTLHLFRSTAYQNIHQVEHQDLIRQLQGNPRSILSGHCIKISIMSQVNSQMYRRMGSLQQSGDYVPYYQIIGAAKRG